MFKNTRKFANDAFIVAAVATAAYGWYRFLSDVKAYAGEKIDNWTNEEK